MDSYDSQSHATKLPRDMWFGYDILGKLYNKYDPCYVVSHR